MPPRRAKRQRTGAGPVFGAPSEADLPSAQNSNPSSSASSTRALPTTTVPALTTLCARIFVAKIGKLARDEGVWEPTRQYLKILPENLVPRVFAMLRASCPTLLSHAFIVAHFLRGPSITLTSSLPGVNKSTISAIGIMGTGLRELEISGFEKYPDTLFATLLPKLPSLRVLVLRGCSKVGPVTLDAAVKSCPHLKVVNLNYTAATPASLSPLVIACPQLEVLKLAGIPNWTDATFSKFLAGIPKDFTLPSLHTLKLRQTALSDASLASIISLCPNLKRLDLSFTLVRHPPSLLATISVPPLEKLCLTSTPVGSADLLAIISLLPHLKTLSLGALGGSQGSSAAIGNSSAMTMNDNTLLDLTTVLADYSHLENINLVGNTKLGVTGKGALASFIARVGRKCKRLNLAGIPSLRSSDLASLMPEDAEQAFSSLEVLILNNTSVDDEATPFISSCPQLGTLEVQGTKFTREGLFPLIDNCSKLEKLDLTSCRGIRVVDRRRFFEVWEDERGDN